MAKQKNHMTLFLCLLLTLCITPAAEAALYEVGPGQAHSDLSSINWMALEAGDEVRIHWRSEPYRSKIGLRCRGTAEAPIKITGVAGETGERPIISGNGATTPSSLNGFFESDTEGLGVIVFHRGPDDEWGYKPGYVEISGLSLQGAHQDYQYTGIDGGQHNYLHAAGGIWAVVVEQLTVRNCEFTDNGNGFFVLSKNSEAEVSRDVLFEGNYVHGNGIAGSDQEHNSYTQAAGITFQYNRYGPLRAGALGIALKDRSANTVIRYNWIQGGSRTLDLVEPEDSWHVMLQEPGFHNTWVYGNVFISEYSLTHIMAVNLFHYGGDMGESEIYRKGILHFYFNTVYVRLNRTDEGFDGSLIWDFKFFDLSTNEETVIMRNNILFRDGDAEIYIGREFGNHIFEANNWINSGWQPSGGEFLGSVTINNAPIEGDSPGLANPAEYDFSVLAGSPVLNAAAALPEDITASHPLTMQYLLHQGGQAREMLGGAFELGAFESAAAQ